MNSNEKQIINFVYLHQLNPGFTKRKSIFAEFGPHTNKVDSLLEKLVLLDYLTEIHQRETSHEGVCYKLSEKGLEAWASNNKNFLQKIWPTSHTFVKDFLITLAVAGTFALLTLVFKIIYKLTFYG